MAGTAKNYTLADLFQGPGDIWVIGAAPADATPRLTLASDGTPDATAHPGSVHLGYIATAVTTAAKPKIDPIVLDQTDAPVASYTGELAATIEAEMAQADATKLQRLLGVGTYVTGSGYDGITFGGNLTVPKACIACISPQRDHPNRYIVSVLFSAAATGGFTVSMGRAKPSFTKTQFTGLNDIARTAGKAVGIIYRTLVDAAGGTPTAKSYDATEIYQGPCDLWIVSPAPTDAAKFVTLDAATLTPDATAHGTSRCFGVLNGPVSLSVMPKLSFFRGDQWDAPVDVLIDSLEAKIEAELGQSGMQNMADALGVGSYTLSAGAYEQVTFGGTDQPAEVCVAAIGRKRTDITKGVVCCLYKVVASSGITWAASRKKPSTYKVSFSGEADLTRTAGRQIGNFWENV